MKKPNLIATVFIVLALLLVFVASPVSAALIDTWYSFNDPLRRTADKDETFSGDETTVYMAGYGFTADLQYKVAYYEADTDPGGGADNATKVATDTPYADWMGALKSEYYFPGDQTANAGEWHAVVYNIGDTPPSVYDPTDVDRVADDSFTVEGSAIPEFPMVITLV